MECKNCGTNLDDNFCKNCGQKSNTQKIDFKYVINEIPNSILQINHGFLFTMKELFTRPGHSIREFIEGKRKKHYKPLAYIIITSTLYVLLNVLIGNVTFMSDLINGMKGVNKSGSNEIFSWLEKYQTYLILLLIPYFSLASYIAYYKSKYNYFEHIILNVYITGQQFLIYLLFSFIYNRNSSLTIVPILLGFIFNFWTYFQFFHKKSLTKKITLFLLTYVVLTLQTLLIMLVAAIFVTLIN